MGQCVQAWMMMMRRRMMMMTMKMEDDGVGGVPGCCEGEDFQS